MGRRFRGALLRRMPDARLNAVIAGAFIVGAVQLTLGLILFTMGSRGVPAAQLFLIALVEPVLSPLRAWAMARELPPIWTFTGGAVIVGAIMIQALFGATRDNRNARRQRRSEPAFDSA